MRVCQSLHINCDAASNAQFRFFFLRVWVGLSCVRTLRTRTLVGDADANDRQAKDSRLFFLCLLDCDGRFSGPRPKGYQPMKKQGSIILGIGGDNSDSAHGECPSSCCCCCCGGGGGCGGGGCCLLLLFVVVVVFFVVVVAFVVVVP